MAPPPGALQAQWLGSALGGPLTYRGPDPSALYSRLAAEKGLNGTHLDTLAQHVAGAMAEMGLSAVSWHSLAARQHMQLS